LEYGGWEDEVATILLLTHPERAKELIQWSARLADTRPGPLMVLCCFEGYPIRDMTSVTSERIISGEGLLRTAKSCIDELGLSAAELWELKHPDIITAIMDIIEKRRVHLLVVGADGTHGSKAAGTYLANRMLRFAAVDTILIDPGQENPEELERILVPMVGSLVSPALKTASGMVRQGGIVAPLLVGPEFGSDSRAVARRELDLKLEEIDIGDTQQFTPVVAIADRALDGIAKASQKNDMLLLGASTDKVLFEIRKKQSEPDSETEGYRCAVGLFRPAKEIAPSYRSAFFNRIFKWLPKLSPTERVKMFDRLQVGTRANPDFLMMMALSTGIATLGLFQGSTAVVIGAMLVAPLMTPLIGAGFALVQGNVRLYRKSMAAMGIGILTGLALSLFISMLAHRHDLSLEIIARASPDVLDIFIALLSGMAAAYAFARPTLMGTLAGVAIAAALVPPLATVGIGLSRGAYPAWNRPESMDAPDAAGPGINCCDAFFAAGIHDSFQTGQRADPPGRIPSSRRTRPINY
jgi:uncharacterized hydrophobic protein (TIGR00271 family)